MEMHDASNFFEAERQSKAQFDARTFNASSLQYLANALQEARGATAFTSQDNKPRDLWKTLGDQDVRGLIERALAIAVADPRVSEDLQKGKYLYLIETTSPYHASRIMGGYDRALEKKGEDANYWEALARIVSSVAQTV